MILYFQALGSESKLLEQESRTRNQISQSSPPPHSFQFPATQHHPSIGHGAQQQQPANQTCFANPPSQQQAHQLLQLSSQLPQVSQPQFTRQQIKVSRSCHTLPFIRTMDKIKTNQGRGVSTLFPGRIFGKACSWGY